MALVLAAALFLQAGNQVDRPKGTKGDRQGGAISTQRAKTEDQDRPSDATPLLQAGRTGVEERSLAQQVTTFAEGDDTPRARILAEGPAAMRVLWPHRNLERVRVLMREIRLAAASPKDRSSADRLAQCRLELPDGLTTLGKALVRVVGTHHAFDPSDSVGLANRLVPPQKGGTSLELLESLCARADVDFAFLYGIVLVASPERLWPPAPQEIRRLTPEERRRVETLVAALGAESAEERDRAMNRLLEMDSAIIPVLEESTQHPDPELSSRCRNVIARLKPKDTRVFMEPAVEKQTLTGASATLYGGTLMKEVTYKVQSLSMRHCLKLLLDQFVVDLRGGGSEGDPMNYSFEGLPIRSILAVITQANGMDYMLEDGRVVVGSREDIRRRVALGNK